MSSIPNYSYQPSPPQNYAHLHQVKAKAKLPTQPQANPHQFSSQSLTNPLIPQALFLLWSN